MEAGGSMSSCAGSDTEEPEFLLELMALVRDVEAEWILRPSAFLFGGFGGGGGGSSREVDKSRTIVESFAK